VKPSNILLSRDGIKLCDFGISGRLNDSKAHTKNIGSLAYLAVLSTLFKRVFYIPFQPERTYTENPYDIKADVWSLGVTAVELATAKCPFQAADELELIKKIREAVPTVAGGESLTVELNDFYRACLRREFHKRPNYRQLIVTLFDLLKSAVYAFVWRRCPSCSSIRECPSMCGSGTGG
jgi:mitogen-activated protein kinase kinase 7